MKDRSVADYISALKLTPGQAMCLRNCKNRASAFSLAIEWNIRYHEAAFFQRKNSVFGIYLGETLVEHSQRKDQEGFAQYGDKWGGKDTTPMDELMDELADAWNYIQHAHRYGEVGENTAAALQHDLMKLFKKAALARAGVFLKKPQHFNYQHTATELKFER